MTRSLGDDCLQPMRHIQSECVQQCPRSALHGPSPLWECISMNTMEGLLDTSVSHWPPPTDTNARWKGSKRLVEGPSSLRDADLQYPPHLSFWLADLREREAFLHGRLPPYARYLGSPKMSPLKSTPKSVMDAPNDVDMKFDSDPNPPHPNWYCTPHGPAKSTCSTLRKPIVDPEAGLHLRYLRITSAFSLFPQLATEMQFLLNKEIRAALQREEIAVLTQVQNHPHPINMASRFRSVSKAGTESCTATSRRLKRTAGSMCCSTTEDRMKKKARVAFTTSYQPTLIVPQNIEKFVSMQPIRPHLYATLYLDEEGILERSWAESMSRRSLPVDLHRKILRASVASALYHARTKRDSSPNDSKPGLFMEMYNTRLPSISQCSEANRRCCQEHCASLTIKEQATYHYQRPSSKSANTLLSHRPPLSPSPL